MMPQQSAPSYSPAHIAEFATGLRLAVHDRALELSGRTLRHFYDADVVIHMILGFRQFERLEVSLTDRALLVRALLASGYLGPAYLLRPHALEVDEKVRTMQRVGSTGARGRWQADVQQFLGAHAVSQGLAEVAASIGSAPSTADAVTRFLEAMEERGSEYFIAIELANGTWQQRLRRLWQHIVRLQPVGTSLAEVMGSPACRVLGAALGDQRPGRALPNLRDAAALATLHELVGLARNGDPLPRFHTETGAILRAARDERVAALLREGGPGSHTVLRSSSYYAVRASFEELWFTTGTEAGTREGLARLSTVSTELDELIRKAPTERDVDQLLANTEFAGHPLSDIIRRYSSLAFVSSIWKKPVIPAAVSSFVVELPTILEFARHGESADLLQERIESDLERIQGDLRAELGELERWFALHERLRRAAAALWARIPPPERHIPDPMRDLGLVRWGASLSHEGQKRLEAYVRMLLSDAEDERAATCAELSSLAVDSAAAEECLIACAILWLLGLFDDVARTIAAFAERQKGQSTLARSNALVVLWTAALARAGRVSLPRLNKLIGDLERRETRTSGKTDRGQLCLGLGYIYYYACRFRSREERPVSAGERRRRADPARREWAAACLLAGERAVELLDPHTLSWAFAVNHCGYVASVFNLDPRNHFKRIEAVARLQSRSDHWHYRFADTLAYYQYLSARRLWQATGPDPAQLANVRERLEEAARLLTYARPNFGDPEITEHLTEVRLLQIEVANTP